MTALTPHVVPLTTGVAALMPLVGLRPQRGPPLSVVRPSDRKPRLPNLHEEAPVDTPDGVGDLRRFGFRYGVVSVPVF